MKLKTKSFTLIEVLLVSSLIAVLGVAIFHTFSNGLKLWARAQRLNPESEVALFLDKIGEDLRSTSAISGIAFKGIGAQLSFPAIVLTKADQRSSRASEGMVNQIGAVRYRFDPGTQTIYRRQANYAQAIKDRWIQEEVPVAVGITELALHYEISSEKRYLLKSTFDEGIPRGVMVEVNFGDDSGKHQLKRYFLIPVGG